MLFLYDIIIYDRGGLMASEITSKEELVSLTYNLDSKSTTLDSVVGDLKSS